MKKQTVRKRFLRRFFCEYFDLNRSKEKDEITIESIKKGVEFKGPSLWILMCATFIASLGLNVNSTAVIIGAMLISPLMGPIMGIGLAMGQNDFELMKKSLKNFAITTSLSITTATIYFYFTPLNEVQSELLARTSPTIYDIFIALWGGMAGIIALATKDKGNVIPGVAIATALMPPLCTAGFGLATGNLMYSAGAFYLYFINTVFISLATFIGVRIMKFPRKEFIDKQKERIVKRYIITTVVVTMCPAIYLTYNIVQETIYKKKADKFISKELVLPETQILSKEISTSPKEIKLVVMGKEIPEERIQEIKMKMSHYDLSSTKLYIYQNIKNGEVGIDNIKKMVLEDFYKNSEEKIAAQELKIDSLNKLLYEYNNNTRTDQKLASEVKVLYKQVESLALTSSIRFQTDNLKADTLVYAIINCKDKMTEDNKNTLKEWLKARTECPKLEMIITTNKNERGTREM